MKLAIGLNFYNDRTGLERLLNSIPSKSVDYIIAVDGAYQYNLETNPDISPLSNDGSRELLKGSAFDVRILNCANVPEYQKRNRYLEYAGKLGDVDYLIIADSDEYFLIEDLNCSCIRKRRTAWNRFKNAWADMVRYYGYRYNVYTMTMYDPVTRKHVQRPRCWYKPGQMRYLFGSHYHWANTVTEQKQIEEHRLLRRMYTQYSIDDIPFHDLVLVNDPSIRSKEQNARREKYQQYLVTYEGLRQVNHSMQHEEAHQLAKMSPAATGLIVNK